MVSLRTVACCHWQKQEAYKAFKHVTRLNPPYELEFNARISMTEVMARGNAKQMISRLKRMAASDNNKEYLDQIYYAIGNIYLNEKDTVQAISAYEKGNAKATRSGIEKGVLLLHLGDLYWGMENTVMPNAVTEKPSACLTKTVKTIRFLQNVLNT